MRSPAVDERDLAQEVTGAQRCHPLPLPLDLDRAVDDDEELVAGGALASKQLTGGDVDLVGEHGEPFELATGEAGEERYPFQLLELLVARHRGPPPQLQDRATIPPRRASDDTPADEPISPDMRMIGYRPTATPPRHSAGWSRRVLPLCPARRI